jgi:hypothetical protein
MGLFSKDIKSLEDLYKHGLQDLYYAEPDPQSPAQDDRECRERAAQAGPAAALRRDPEPSEAAGAGLQAAQTGAGRHQVPVPAG